MAGSLHRTRSRYFGPFSWRGVGYAEPQDGIRAGVTRYVRSFTTQRLLGMPTRREIVSNLSDSSSIVLADLASLATLLDETSDERSLRRGEEQFYDFLKITVLNAAINAGDIIERGEGGAGKVGEAEHTC